MSAVDNLGFVQELNFRRGADLILQLQLFADQIGGTPFNLTGCEVRACIKARTGGAVYNFVVTNAPLGADGIVSLRLTAAETGAIPASPASKMAVPIYDWYVDVKLGDGKIIPYCYGPATCTEGGPSWS